jgi:DNA invertase Pin-like site-specific DNA recombinase
VLIGYARVSTSDQKLDMQRDELKRAGCKKVFTDVASGARDRPGRAESLAFARKGDTIVVWKLDRFGRSLVDLVQTIQQLRDRGVGFRSLHESIDTTTSGGRLIFHVFSALAEFERDLIRERTMAGLAAARARGRKGGRKPVLNVEQESLLRKLAADRNNTPAFICATLGISRTSFYRYLSKPAAPPVAAPSSTRSTPAAGRTSSSTRSTPATGRTSPKRRPKKPAGSRPRRLPAAKRKVTVKAAKRRR